jgi:hypothetical protein
MTHLIETVRRLVIAFLVYVAAFMKEEQEGHWENTLQLWLNKVTNRQAGSYAKVTALAQAVSGLSQRATVRLFGQRLLSFRAFGVSFFYSLASLFLTALLSPVIVRLAHHIRKTAPPQSVLPHGVPPLAVSWAILVFILLLAVGSIPAIFEKHDAAGIWTWIFWLLVVGSWTLPFLTIVAIVNHLWGYYSALRFVFGILFICGVNFLIDIIFVKTTRWALGLAANTRKPSRVFAAILFDAVLGYGVIVGPILLSTYMFTRFHTLNISLALLFSFAMKSIDFLIALIVFIILAVIGVHVVVWFLLERPIYSCVRFKVIRW